MQEVQLKALDISCEHCERAITDAVRALPGVESVRVDIPNQLVTVQYDPARIDRSAIEATLDEEGYPVTH